MNAITGFSTAVDLAHEPDFRLRGLLVRPSVCRVIAAGAERRVEPRVMEVLVRLARSLNQTVTRDELIDCCWGGRIISDDAVSRVIHQVRSLARDLDPAPFTLETVPKVGFRLVVGEAEPAVEPPPPGRPATILAAFGRRPRLAAALALLLLLLVGAGAAWRFSPQGAADQNGRVAVMPFTPLREEVALQRYSAALGGALVRLLASNGVDTFQQPLSSQAGGRDGDAEFRVAGTIDREGDDYVINAQILRGGSGEILWSGRFARDAAAPVGFQEEAANRIAAGLDCALWHRAAERKPMTSRIFSLFLKACVACAGSHRDSQAFMQAAARLAAAAPDYSYAHSLHAGAMALVAADPRMPAPEVEALRRAVEAAAQRALRLDPRNGEAHLALGLRYQGAGHWLERERSFEEAEQLDSSLGGVRNSYVNFLREVGRWQEAEAMSRGAVVGNPFSPGQIAMLLLLRAAAGDFAEAEDLARRIDLIDPQMARELRYTVALFWADPREAIPQIAKYAPSPPGRDLACHQAYLARLVAARGAPLRGLPSPCEGVDDHSVRLLAREGDIDGAYAALTANPDRFRFFVLLYYPEMKAFRRDPRFWPLAARLGLADYWTKSGRWPDFCAEPDLPYNCKAAAAAALRAEG